MIEERKSPGTNSWKFSNSIHSNIMDEDLIPKKKLNVIHYACIGLFLGLAFCSIAATIYAFVT